MNKKLDVEDMKKLVTRVYFSFAAYLTGEDEIDVRKTDEGGTVKVESMQNHVYTDYCISQDEWDSFISKLYDELKIYKWKRNYRRDDGIIMDGAFWELDISVEGRRERIYRGDNAYPDNWDDLEYLMKKFIRRKRK